MDGCHRNSAFSSLSRFAATTRASILSSSSQTLDALDSTAAPPPTSTMTFGSFASFPVAGARGFPTDDDG